MEMSSTRSIMVVAPGCPAGLIQELLDDHILSAQTNVEVLLPPGIFLNRDNSVGRGMPSGEVKFVPSPARRFFSTRHLKWLKEYLRCGENVMVLIPKSPYQDPVDAIASLLVMLWLGKTITLLRPAGDQPESGSDLIGPNLNGKWMIIKFNVEILIKEFRKTVWSLYPGFIKNFINHAERELSYFFGVYGFEVDGSVPVNLQPLDSSPEALTRDINYALGTACTWIDCLPGGEAYLKGKRVLEIGPGINFGTILVMACHGAKVLLTDRFLTPWNPDYHPKVYTLLRDKLAERWPSIDLTPLNMIISQGCYPRDIISMHTCSLERLSGVPYESVDLVISNAVFEHLYDLKSAFSHLARITKPGGMGLHQVDFRDHRDYSRPLEHLLLSDKDFSRLFKERHGECGNRYRPGEMWQLFESAGFEIRKFHPNIFTDEEYLKEFLERLRQARESRYRDYNAEDLSYVSGLFIVVKKSGSRG